MESIRFDFLLAYLTDQPLTGTGIENLKFEQTSSETTKMENRSDPRLGHHANLPNVGESERWPRDEACPPGQVQGDDGRCCPPSEANNKDCDNYDDVSFSQSLNRLSSRLIVHNFVHQVEILPHSLIGTTIGRSQRGYY